MGATALFLPLCFKAWRTPAYWSLLQKGENLNKAEIWLLRIQGLAKRGFLES